MSIRAVTDRDALLEAIERSQPPAPAAPAAPASPAHAEEGPHPLISQLAGLRMQTIGMLHQIDAVMAMARATLTSAPRAPAPGGQTATFDTFEGPAPRAD